MSIRKRLKSMFPKGFLWRITFLNIIVITSAIALSGWAVYNTACFLVEGIGSLNEQRQRQFNATLFQYLWIFSMIGIIVGSMLHFYFTKKLINPIRQLIVSTKQMKKGKYPIPISVTSQDEVGELVQQYNGLIKQLQTNDLHRQKLVSDLSHEIRTPLTNLNGYLNALHNGVIEGDEKVYLSLYQESNRLTLMVEQLEQLKEWDYVASQTIAKKHKIDIADQINQCVTMVEWKLAQAEIPVEVEAESVDLTVHIQGIQQVISNLLDNSIRYYQGYGSIVLKGEVLEEDYRISVVGPSEQIPEEERKNVFERFYRLDTSRSRETGGTGLGLAIAKEIVEYHHGEIGVVTNQKSNMFWFTLPLNN